MASFWSQWPDLEVEIINAVRGATPNSNNKLPFRTRTDDEREASADIRSCAGGDSRQFHVVPPDPLVRVGTIGGDVRHKDAHFQLEIYYQGGHVWRAKAADDAEMLAELLRDTAFTNADYVNAEPDGSTIEPIDEDDPATGWILTIQLFAPIQIS